jgi:hypothetical protein
LRLNFTYLQMTFIKPDDEKHRNEILENLATNVARRISITMRPYDATAVTDTSGNVHWMHKFDEYERRIYRTQNGTQRMANLDIERSEFIDLNHVEDEIKAAIEILILKDY